MQYQPYRWLSSLLRQVHNGTVCGAWRLQFVRDKPQGPRGVSLLLGMERESRTVPGCYCHQPLPPHLFSLCTLPTHSPHVCPEHSACPGRCQTLKKQGFLQVGTEICQKMASDTKCQMLGSANDPQWFPTIAKMTFEHCTMPVPSACSPCASLSPFFPQTPSF